MTKQSNKKSSINLEVTIANDFIRRIDEICDPLEDEDKKYLLEQFSIIALKIKDGVNETEVRNYFHDNVVSQYFSRIPEIEDLDFYRFINNHSYSEDVDKKRKGILYKDGSSQQQSDKISNIEDQSQFITSIITGVIKGLGIEQNTKGDYPVEFTGDKIELIKLIYGLYYSGHLNHGKGSIRKIAKHICENFGISYLEKDNLMSSSNLQSHTYRYNKLEFFNEIKDGFIEYLKNRKKFDPEIDK